MQVEDKNISEEELKSLLDKSGTHHLIVHFNWVKITWLKEL